MPGLVPGIHDLLSAWLDVDGRDKPGHDVAEASALVQRGSSGEDGVPLPGCKCGEGISGDGGMPGLGAG